MKAIVISAGIWLCSFGFLQSQSSGLLPIYSKPMVFLDSTGQVVGKAPGGFVLINTPNGQHDSGWMRGMAGNTAGANGLIPMKNFDTHEMVLLDHTGKQVVRYGNRYSSVTPNYEGFHLAFEKKKERFGTSTKYHFLDRFGAHVFSPIGYDAATVFNEGKAAVREGSKWFYINDLGHEFHVIDTTLKRISSVSAFHDGLSLIKFGLATKCGFSHCNDYAFINREGEIVLDTRELFPGAQIKKATVMHDEFSLITFHSDSTIGPSDSIAYLHKSGRIIGPIDNVFRETEFSCGYAPIITLRRTQGPGSENDSIYLLDKSGVKLFFDAGEGYTPRELVHISDSFYYVIFRNDALEKGMSRVYNTKTHAYVYETRDDVMGIKWTLISLRDSRTKRYYVVDYRTGNIVYDTDASDRNWTDVASALAQADRVRTFTCTNSADLEHLNKFRGLTSLTLRGMDVEALPEPFDFPDLKTLRIDGLMQLTTFPSHLKGLEKIALRNCVKAENLMDLLTDQSALKELFIINFDLTSEQKAGIRAGFPGAKVVIEGSARLASAELQMVIEGFE